MGREPGGRLPCTVELTVEPGRLAPKASLRWSGRFAGPNGKDEGNEHYFLEMFAARLNDTTTVIETDRLKGDDVDYSDEQHAIWRKAAEIIEQRRVDVRAAGEAFDSWAVAFNATL